MRSILFLVVTLVSLAGCGSKGALVLPPKSAAPAAAPAPADHSSKPAEAAR